MSLQRHEESGTNLPVRAAKACPAKQLASLVNQIKRSGDIDRSLNRTGHRATVGLDGVHALNSLAMGFRGPQFVMRVDAADDQNVSVSFDFTGDFRNQPAVAGVNLARFQRTAKSAGRSPTCRRNNVVKSRRTRGKFVRRDLVVRGNFGMDAEHDGVFFGRQISKPKGTDLPFNTDPRCVGNIRIFQFAWPHRSNSSSFTA